MWINKLVGILIAINQKPPKDITEGILLNGESPEINRDWTQIGGARETQWTTVAVLRACSELTLFARFL